MTIKEITDIKPGHLIEIKSDRGGCDKAPCTKEVALISSDYFTSTDKDDDDCFFPLSMENYLGTIDIAADGDKPRKVIHQFSQ